MVRDRISSQQKQLIFKKANLKVLDPGKKPEDVEISLTEKISRYIKKNWFGMDMLSDHEYKQKLQLYEKSRSIQNARYLQIDKRNLRFREVKPHSSKKEFIRHLSHGHIIDSECHRTSCRVDIQQIKDLDFNLDDPKIQVDLNFMTHKTVGKKR